MKVNKKDLLAALKSDLSAAEELKKIIDDKIAERRAVYNGDLYGNEEDGKSKVVPKVAKRQSEWAHASVKDPFVSTPDIIKCTPITAEDVSSARQNELLLNYQFCRQFDRYKFMTKAIKVLDMDATLVVQVGWEYEADNVTKEVESVKMDEDDNEYIAMDTVDDIDVKKNQPTAKVCRSEDIYIDPTCQDSLDDAQFVIYRYETDLSTLKKDGRYKNLDKLSENEGEDKDYTAEDDTLFKFKDKPRQKMVAYEYWGNYDVDGDGIVDPIVCTWIGNTVIRLQGNPYPDKKPPFIVVPFSSVPFQIHGENNIDLIGDQQKIITAITRGIINNMAQSTNGQVGIRKGALDAIQRKKFFGGKNFEFNGSPADFWQGSYNQIPGSAFDMMAVQNNEIESLTGTKGFSQGMSGNALGTMLDIDTDIPMIDGSFKKLVDITDGDVVVGSDGHGTKVVVAHDVAYPEVAYDMHFDNGSIVKSGGEHLWTVKVHGTSHSLREWTTMDADTVYEHMKAGRRVTIPKMKEVHTGISTGNSIDPYVLGYWLGDGMSHSARITTADLETVELFKIVGYECVEVIDSSRCGNAKMYDVYKIGFKPTRNSTTGQYESTGSLHSELRELGLMARYGGVKHIPEEYFTATYEEKMELIRGLMDSDGFAHSGAFVQFAQSESPLKDDFIKLLGTMGLKTSIRIKYVDDVNRNKQLHADRTGTKMIHARRDSYEIGFTPWNNPFKLARKANKWKEPSIETVCLKSMEIVDKVLMRCLTVDSEDHLYAVTDKFTLTHNTATGVRGVLDATSTRRLDLVRNIAENLIKPLMRKWMCYNAEFLSEEEVVRVTNEEFVQIRRDDLSGRVDIDIAISTAEDNANKASELSFLLQTLGNSVPFEMTQLVLGKIADLARMPDLAMNIRQYKPQPDPVAEKMKELQLAKLQADIELVKANALNKNASAGENESDKAEKMAGAELKRAQARKLMSEADNLDLDFVKNDEQVSQQETLQKEELKHAQALELENMRRLARLDEMAFQVKYGKSKEQIGVPK